MERRCGKPLSALTGMHFLPLASCVDRFALFFTDDVNSFGIDPSNIISIGAFGLEGIAIPASPTVILNASGVFGRRWKH